ncbi:hypothetical protein PTKIN_Ptkin12aG0215800 [Pterospermum kingtungense]
MQQVIQRKTQHLLVLDGAKERLHLFKAELLDEGCFDSIVDGCQGVFHTASPAFFSAPNPQAEIIDPAIKGTLNVLKSCARVSSIKRVVITGSMASVLYSAKPLTPDVVVDETWFSDPRFCEENKLWYMVSKTLAEKAAGRFAEENKMDLVILNPGFVIGLLLQPALNFSSEIVLSLMKGENTYRGGSYRFIDVRDVAHAHIQGFEIPSAAGRYCLVQRVVHHLEALKTLAELYPTSGLQDKCEDGKELIEGTFQVSKEKAKGLGLSFIPWDLRKLEGEGLLKHLI